MMDVAVVIPCFNEVIGIANVVSDFRLALPEATIYVYDNNSTDDTFEVARGAGALVRREQLQGKGHVIRRMFADVEADIYVLVDGDSTYDAYAAPAMIRMLLDRQLDMVSGVRVHSKDQADIYRRGHQLGNRLLTDMVGRVFGRRVTDMLSGYRVFSRRFVKSFPALSEGFEIETEFSVHALELDMPMSEMPTEYRARPLGSTSKLRTWSDGFRVLKTILILIRQERPLQFFAAMGAALMAVGLLLGLPVVLEFLRTSLVPRLPTAVLATAFVSLSFLAFTCGLILDTVARGRKEAKRLAYLSQRGVAALQHCDGDVVASFMDQGASKTTQPTVPAMVYRVR